MNSTPKPRQRRRVILTCIECRKRKQKCDRGNPCAQCIARGPESICIYEKFKSKHAPSLSFDCSLGSVETTSKAQQNHDGPLLRHAHNYGYSNSDPLTSMSMLNKVISDIDSDISAPNTVSSTAVTPHSQSKSRAEYYGYVRRLPSKDHCEILFQYFFNNVNPLNSQLEETIFREQLVRWWHDANEIILRQAPEKLSSSLWYFPALMFQVLAIALRFVPQSYDVHLDGLRFCPSQTLHELSREYTDCGVSLSSLPGKPPLNLVAVQHSAMRDWWLVNTGDILRAWNHSRQTVKDAMAIGLHLEPTLPSSSNPDELLDALWMNELRKRIWLSLVVWDNYMALSLGRPMFIDIRKCTVTAPMDCTIPTDRLKRVPVPRTSTDKPLPMTERVHRFEITKQIHAIRELESQGSIPNRPEKVKELHDFAIKFRKDLPAFYRTTNPDTTWDASCHYVPIHREMLSYLVDSFLMALHRPYIFTRVESQREVYNRALAILNSQDRLFAVTSAGISNFYIGITFPTFDAAVLLAVVLVSYPELYAEKFSRPYMSLRKAFERLKFIGEVLPLAKTGSEILECAINRAVEGYTRVGGTPLNDTSIEPSSVAQSGSGKSSSVSPDPEPWRFEANPTGIEWAAQNPEFFNFDFSNLEVPMPLKELLLDEEMTGMQDGLASFDPNSWTAPMGSQTELMNSDIQGTIDAVDNSLWNFLAGYPNADDIGGDSSNA